MSEFIVASVGQGTDVAKRENSSANRSGYKRVMKKQKKISNVPF